MCRVEDIRNQTWNKLRKIFNHVSSIKLEQDVNELLFCFKSKPSVSHQQAAAQLNSIVKYYGLQEDNVLDVTKIQELIRYI